MNEISPKNNPELIIELSKWAKKDDTIKNYVTAVKNQGRKLVFGEYCAAEDWMDSAESRDKVKQAETILKEW